jgi:hypothetical protein
MSECIQQDMHDKKFLVNFLIVGTQKGGTTALSTFLAKHPEICFAPSKEVHFFDNEHYNPNTSVPMLNQRYKSYFPNWEGQHIIGEATPIYMYLPFIAERIYKYNPNMKLIFLLRDPVERALSQYTMERGRNSEVLPYSIALALEPLRLWFHKNNLTETSSLRSHSYIDRGFYARQIKEIERYFSREQMLFLKSTDLLKNHVQTLLCIYDFLGIIDTSILPDQEFIFVGKKSSIITTPIHTLITYYLNYRYKKSNQELYNYLGWKSF